MPITETTNVSAPPKEKGQASASSKVFAVPMGAVSKVREKLAQVHKSASAVPDAVTIDAAQPAPPVESSGKIVEVTPETVVVKPVETASSATATSDVISNPDKTSFVLVDNNVAPTPLSPAAYAKSVHNTDDSVVNKTKVGKLRISIEPDKPCMQCGHLVAGQKKFFDCTVANGNKTCPAGEVEVVTQVPIKKAAAILTKALVAHDTEKLLAFFSRLDDYRKKGSISLKDIERVIRRAIKKYGEE